MSERNTPGVGGVLEAAGIDAIPEAHCYLTYQGRRFDFTGLAPGCASPFDTLIEERTVSPSEVTSVKAAFHGDALAKWADRKSTRLNSSHQIISYAVFCLKKKKTCRTADSVLVDADARRLRKAQLRWN